MSIEPACAVHQPGQSCFVETGALFQISHLKLHTSHFTLHLISSRLSFSHLVSANLFSSHLISSHMSSKFFSTIFISSKDCSTLLISSKLFLTHLNRKLLHIGTFYTEKLLHTQKLLQTEAFAQRLLHAQNGNRIHKILPCTTLYYKPCSKHFPVLLSTATLRKALLLQSLHRSPPSTTLYYKACTKHFPVLPCTTELAQSTSQYCE